MGVSRPLWFGHTSVFKTTTNRLVVSVIFQSWLLLEIHTRFDIGINVAFISWSFPSIVVYGYLVVDSRYLT